jgi:hypothetical protein
MRKFYKLFAVVLACLMLATPTAFASDEKVVTIGGDQPYREIADFMMMENIVGTVYVFSNANPSVLTPLTPGAAGGGTVLGTQWIVHEGMLEQTMSADPGGAAGDHITWYMTYVPLAASITVTAQ